MKFELSKVLINQCSECFKKILLLEIIHKLFLKDLKMMLF